VVKEEGNQGIQGLAIDWGISLKEATSVTTACNLKMLLVTGLFSACGMSSVLSVILFPTNGKELSISADLHFGEGNWNQANLLPGSGSGFVDLHATDRDEAVKSYLALLFSLNRMCCSPSGFVSTLP